MSAATALAADPKSANHEGSRPRRPRAAGSESRKPRLERSIGNTAHHEGDEEHEERLGCIPGADGIRPDGSSSVCSVRFVVKGLVGRLS